MKQYILVSLILILLIPITIATDAYNLSIVNETVSYYYSTEDCLQLQLNVTAYCNEAGKRYGECWYSHDYIPTSNCVEYKNGTKTGIESDIYLFEWCEVYPDSVTQNCTEYRLNKTQHWYNNTLLSVSLIDFNVSNFTLINDFNATYLKRDYCNYDWNITCNGSCKLRFEVENCTFTDITNRSFRYIEYPNKCKEKYFRIFGWDIFAIKC